MIEMDSTTKAALSYVFGWLTGLVFLLTEKQDEFVRKNAAQSFVLSLLLMVLTGLCSVVPFLRVAGVASLGVLGAALWILLIVKSSRGVYYRLPFVSDLSEKYVLDWFK